MNLNNEKLKFWERFENPSVSDIENQSYQFSLFVANVKKFLPDVHKDMYQNFYSRLLYQKWLSKIEQSQKDLVENIHIINDTSYNLVSSGENRSLIFATFHIGPFRLFNSFLLKNGYKIVLIIDENVFVKQQEEMFCDAQTYLKANSNADFVILNVKDKSSIFKLKKFITNGYVLSVYLDGNTGISNTRNNEFDRSYIPIIFFKNTIYVKNGIGRLSLLLGVNIIPVISYRDKNENPIIHFHKEIKISDFEDRKSYPNKSIEIAYHILEENLKTHKEQWNDWFTIHRLFKRNSNTPYESISSLSNKFNDERYSLFVRNGFYFIFDLLDFISYPISLETYNLIKNSNLSEINNSLMNEFVNKNIVV